MVWILTDRSARYIITYPCSNYNDGLKGQTVVEVGAWMNNYIPHIKINVITYPYLNVN